MKYDRASLEGMIAVTLETATRSKVNIKPDFAGGHTIKFRRAVGFDGTISEAVTLDSGDLHHGYNGGELVNNLKDVAARVRNRLDASEKEYWKSHSTVIDKPVERELSLDEKRALEKLEMMAGTTIDDYEYSSKAKKYMMKADAVGRILTEKLASEVKKKEAELFKALTGMATKASSWSERETTAKSAMDEISDTLARLEASASGKKDYMEKTTSADTFDLIKMIIARVNAAVLSSSDRFDECSMWAKVKTLSGAELQIIDGEKWEFEKVVFSERFERLVVILSPAEPGEDIALSASEIEDTFPIIANAIDKAICDATEGKTKNFRAFAQTVYKFSLNSPSFKRPLSEMTHATVAKAKEVAKKRIDEAKANFYEASPLYGLI